MYFVYILKSARDQKLYTGFTADLRRRLVEHNQGQNISTASRGPFKLVYYEAYSAKSDAIRRELRLKQHKGAFAQLKKRIEDSEST